MAGMTKSQLVRRLADKVGTDKKTAQSFLNHLTNTAVKETKKNGVFSLPGLGRFVVAHRKARSGRNPMSGDSIQIKAKTVVTFRMAKRAKDEIAPPPDRIIRKIR